MLLLLCLLFIKIYIGLVIGVLGVTVILLMVTIVVMMRRNKQKIFNKHSMMFKSPLSDRHMMRDLTPLNSCPPGGPSVTSKLYDESELEESTSIYHEPYRYYFFIPLITSLIESLCTF
jgi:hypothetical protein